MLFLVQYTSKEFDRSEKTVATGDCCYFNPLVRRTFRFLGKSQACAIFIIHRKYKHAISLLPLEKGEKNKIFVYSRNVKLTDLYGFTDVHVQNAKTKHLCTDAVLGPNVEASDVLDH